MWIRGLILTVFFAILVARAADACGAKPADQLLALQILHPDNGCLQCDAFRVGDILNATLCGKYESTTGVPGAGCGLAAASFVLTSKMCASGTLSCVPSKFGQRARWATAVDSSDDFTFISDESDISSVLAIQCSNTSTWTILNTNRDGPHAEYAIPAAQAEGNFTLHCVSLPASAEKTTTTVVVPIAKVTVVPTIETIVVFQPVPTTQIVAINETTIVTEATMETTTVVPTTEVVTSTEFTETVTVVPDTEVITVTKVTETVTVVPATKVVTVTEGTETVAVVSVNETTVITESVPLTETVAVAPVTVTEATTATAVIQNTFKIESKTFF